MNVNMTPANVNGIISSIRMFPMSLKAAIHTHLVKHNKTLKHDDFELRCKDCRFTYIKHK